MTLTEFILERIAEDEAVAKAADTVDFLFDLDGKSFAHIARHDPARALAQCAALREVIALHRRDPLFGGSCSTCTGADDEPERYPCPTLRALATIYVGRTLHTQED